MDTKSKKTKRYPLWIKALCVILTVLCLLGTYIGALYAVIIIGNAQTDRGDPFSKIPDNFYDSTLFRNVLTTDLAAINNLVSYPQQMQKLEAKKANRDTIVDAQVQRYLENKAAIIRGEIYYVATHYNETDGDYYYDAYMRDFSTTTVMTAPTSASQQTDAAEQTAESSAAVPDEPTTSVKNDALNALPKVTVDERAPYNVRYCQKLVNTVTGLDWLQYASLVRSDAFTEQAFFPDFGDLGHEYTSITYDADEATVRADLTELFDAQINLWTENYEENKDRAQTRLDEAVNLKYHAVASDGTEYTNMEKTASTVTDGLRITCQNGEVSIRPDMEKTNEISETVRIYTTDSENKPFSLTFSLPTNIQSGDRYADAYAQFEWVHRFPVKTAFGFGVACIVGWLLFFIALLCLCGHKAGTDGITLSFIDRVPTDLHFLASWIAIFICVVLFIANADQAAMWTDVVYTDWEERLILFLALPAALCTAWLLFLEWLVSTVRIKKAGNSYFKRFVLWKVCPLIWKGIRFLSNKVKKAALYILEKPKKIRYIFLLATVVYAALAVLWTLIAMLGFQKPGLFEVGFAILTALYALFQIRYLRTLDTIIDCSCDRSSLPIPDTDAMPPALRLLADNLSITSNELDKAVAQAVRDARTKTELITNVSHDLKTPLTSIISYVDLLKQCDITDEKAKGYLEILEEKSANLKRLIEDLIEASKVSTGNVELHCTSLNLSELAMQAVVESTLELEERGLEVKFSDTPDALIVFADGAKTHRVLENLLSNVKKYAADHSRVYIRVFEANGFGVFEIKNVSREPLDIDPQTLMERFVRGDASRSQDGNGLGLSIAQQLCALQGGRLDIQIDGDLFKASVLLPMKARYFESQT